MQLQLHLVYVRDFGDDRWFLSAIETDFALVVAHHEEMLAKHPLVRVESITKETVEGVKKLAGARLAGKGSKRDRENKRSHKKAGLRR
jgi:hypothetical protein